MQIGDLTFEVRDSTFKRVAQLNPGTDGLTSFKATVRFNNVGAWELTIPETVPDAVFLTAPGAGLIVTGPNGVLFSGPVVSATNTKESGSPIGEWLVRGATDTIILGERLAYPTPSTATVSAQTSAYDASSGKASTVMYGYVDRNLISGAASRKISGLSNAADTAIGSTVTFAARFQSLGDLCGKIANVSTPVLGFDVKQSGSGLVFSVYQPSDKSKLIRMDTDNGTLTKTTYGYGYGFTRAIVGGQGQLTNRQFVEVTNSNSSAAESTWSRRVEVFVDQNNETDTTKLTQAGLDKLTDQGNITSVDVVPSSDSTMEFGVDWNLGDTVSVVVAGQEISAIVSQASLTVSEDGVRVGATVGTPSGFDFDNILMKRQSRTSSDVTTLQLKETAGSQVLVPAGGAANAVLRKNTATDYDDSWALIADANIAAAGTANIAPGKILGTAVTLADTGTVSNTMLGANAVTSAKILDGTIVDADISPSAAISTSKLAANSITIGGTATALGGTAPTLGVLYGGTGATTASGARTNLGVNAPGDTGIPYRQSAGSIVQASNATYSAVTFPASRFSVAPIVTCQVTSQPSGLVTVPYITGGVSSTGFSVGAFTLGGTLVASTINWQATQMTSSAAAG